MTERDGYGRGSGSKVLAGSDKKNTNKIDMTVRSVLSPLITLIKMHSQSLESQKKRKREKCCVGL